MTEMDEIIKEFLVESNDNLDQLDAGLVELEKDPQSQELLGSIFRAIHTVKGTSGVLGYPKLEAIAHVGESLLSKMRDGKLKLNTEITSGLLTMVDAIREILNAIESGGSEGEGDYAPLTKSLNDLLAQELARPENQEKAPPPKRLGEILAEELKVPQQAIEAALLQQQQGDLRRIGEILVEQGQVAPHAVLDALKTQAESASHVATSSIRVDVCLVDKLMNLVGELVLARNQVLQYTASQKDATFLATAQRLNLITTELQEGVMKTRMQPIGNVWNKFTRVVRDLSVQFGKQVRLETEGADTELDKTVLEAIKDPLTHVVRNSVDHGIEMPDRRTAQGKPAQGRILLRAFHEGGQVNIEISDDGGGIHLGRLKKKAIERGQITTEQANRLSEREALNLIFLPGLSTAEQVTNVSGRGVGMDVVKTNVEKIGGTVDIYSVPQQGTTLKIKIPLTLAIIPALIATSGGERFAIPQVNLLELVRLEGEGAATGVENVHGAPVYRLRGDLLPLVYLNQQLKLGRENAANRVVNIVVLRADGRQFGLVVDEINDTEEIVVKPLGKELKNLDCFAGATILGDGKVALILDVLGIARMANVVAEVHDRAVTDASKEGSDKVVGRDAWLVFTAGGNRMAIPLGMVARLEEFPATQVERSGKGLVVQYRDQIMQLVDIASELGMKQSPNPDGNLQVVVYSQAGQSVERIVDVVEQAVEMEAHGGSGALLGSAVLQERVTDLLDVGALVSRAITYTITHAIAQEMPA
jgi:two-component system chemotaxis sensor kinase CheA